MITDIQDIIIQESTTILESIQIIDNTSKQIVLVTDQNQTLLGTLNDGDIRRAILKGKDLNSSIKDVYSTHPIYVQVNTQKSDIIKLCLTHKIHQIPIVNESLKLIGLEILDDLIKQEKKANQVILMVGGLGKRLYPLTHNVPKPMLPIGEKPILQNIIEKFSKNNFKNIILCVNYRAEIIKEYFKDGSDFDVNITYTLEDQKMGTAGALSLLEDRPTQPFFVMNGDILTDVNFEHLLDYHLNQDAIATMCVRTYTSEIPFGVVKINGIEISSIVEKPSQQYFVNAGIYILSPSVIQYIPKNTFYDMTNLFEKLISLQQKVIAFPIREYWIDIGQLEEYRKANQDYYSLYNV